MYYITCTINIYYVFAVQKLLHSVCCLYDIFLFPASLVTSAVSLVIPGPRSGLQAPAFVPSNASPLNYFVNRGSSRSSRIVSIPLSVIATNDDHADDMRSPAGIVKEVIANAAKKVTDIVADVKDKVADAVDDAKDVVSDVIGNVRDKVKDIIDDAKTGGTSAQKADNDAGHGSNETLDETVDVDALDVNSNEKVDVSSKDEDRRHKDNSASAEDDEKTSADDATKSGTSSSKDDKIKNQSGENATPASTTTNDSHEQDPNNNNNNNDGGSKEADNSVDVWSFLKRLSGDREVGSGDDDSKVKRYLTQMSKVRGYLDAIDSSIAASQARQTGKIRHTE